MISCPNCGKENADNSVHCGFCGNQLQEGGKKTMFGLAALNADQIKAAAEQAKEQAAAAASAAPGVDSVQVGEEEADPNAKTEMMPSIGSLPPLGAPGGLPPLGAPGSAMGSEATDDSQEKPAEKPDPFADDFAALEQQFGDDPEFAEGATAPMDAAAAAPTPAATPAPTPEASKPAEKPKVNVGGINDAAGGFDDIDEPAPKSKAPMIIGGVVILIILVVVAVVASGALGG